MGNNSVTSLPLPGIVYGPQKSSNSNAKPMEAFFPALVDQLNNATILNETISKPDERGAKNYTGYLKTPDGHITTFQVSTAPYTGGSGKDFVSFSVGNSNLPYDPNSKSNHIQVADQTGKRVVAVDLSSWRETQVDSEGKEYPNWKDNGSFLGTYSADEKNLPASDVFSLGSVMGQEWKDTQTGKKVYSNQVTDKWFAAGGIVDRILKFSTKESSK